MKEKENALCRRAADKNDECDGKWSGHGLSLASGDHHQKKRSESPND